MKRYAAHFVYCHPQRIIRNGVVELDENGQIVRFFSLNDYPEETHSTEFFNGILLTDLFAHKFLAEFNKKPIFETLDILYQSSENRLEEKQRVPLFLVENIDLGTMLIESDSILRRIN
jgi:hypothetical protein